MDDSLVLHSHDTELNFTKGRVCRLIMCLNLQIKLSAKDSLWKIMTSSGRQLAELDFVTCQTIDADISLKWVANVDNQHHLAHLQPLPPPADTFAQVRSRSLELSPDISISGLRLILHVNTLTFFDAFIDRWDSEAFPVLIHRCPCAGAALIRDKPSFFGRHLKSMCFSISVERAELQCFRSNSVLILDDAALDRVVFSFDAAKWQWDITSTKIVAERPVGCEDLNSYLRRLSSRVDNKLSMRKVDVRPVVVRRTFMDGGAGVSVEGSRPEEESGGVIASAEVISWHLLVAKIPMGATHNVATCCFVLTTSKAAATADDHNKSVVEETGTSPTLEPARPRSPTVAVDRKLRRRVTALSIGATKTVLSEEAKKVGGREDEVVRFADQNWRLHVDDLHMQWSEFFRGHLNR